MGASAAYVEADRAPNTRAVNGVAGADEGLELALGALAIVIASASAPTVRVNLLSAEAGTVESAVTTTLPVASSVYQAMPDSADLLTAESTAA